MGELETIVARLKRATHKLIVLDQSKMARIKELEGALAKQARSWIETIGRAEQAERERDALKSAIWKALDDGEDQENGTAIMPREHVEALSDLVPHDWPNIQGKAEGGA